MSFANNIVHTKKGGLFMKKLIITYRDGSSITYTMKNSIDHAKYLNKHIGPLVKSAVLQKYPKKNNEPEILI